MSDNTERPAADDTSPVSPPRAVSPPVPGAAGPAPAPEASPRNHILWPIPPRPAPGEDPTEELKRDLEKTRLSPELLAQFIAELPPPEERERLYRELMENGGLSFEQLFEPYEQEAEPQP